MNISKKQLYNKVITALIDNAHDLSKAYNTLAEEKTYNALLNTLFLKKDNIYLNSCLYNISGNRGITNSDIKLLDEHEEIFNKENIDIEEMMLEQNKCNFSVINSFNRFIELIKTNPPKFIINNEYNIIFTRISMLSINDKIIKNTNSYKNYKLDDSPFVWEMKKKIYLALSKLYERKANIYISLLNSNEKDSDIEKNSNIFKLFNISKSIFSLEKNLRGLDEEGFEDNGCIADKILNGDTTYETKEFNMNKIDYKINHLDNILKIIIEKIFEKNECYISNNEYIQTINIMKSFMEVFILYTNIHNFYENLNAID